MSSWRDLEVAEPLIAKLGRWLLSRHGKAYLATVTAFAGPRVHPVSPVVRSGLLIAGINKTSAKYRDLIRDRRFVLHALPGPGDAEFWIRGTVRTIEEDEAGELAARHAELRVSDKTQLFELGIEMAQGATYEAGPDGLPIADRKTWKSASREVQVRSRIRHLELVPLPRSVTAVRGLSPNWYRVDAPAESVTEIVRAWDAGGEDTTPELAELREALTTLLIDDGALLPRPPGNDACRLLIAADDVLGDRLRACNASFTAAGTVAVDQLAAHPITADVVLVIRDGLSSDELGAVGADLRKRGVTWAPVSLAEGTARFGPIFTADGDLTVTDLLGRWTASATEPPWGPDTPSVRRFGSWRDFSSAELAWIGGVIGVELSRFAAGEPHLSSRAELELDPASLRTETHIVLPLPFGEGAEIVPSPSTGSMEDLVDPRTGVIRRLKRVEHHESIPRELITVHSSVAALRRICPWVPDPVAGGTSYVSEELARQAAIGESVERYCGEIIRPDLLIESSWSELTARGEHAVDPDTLVMFSEAQYASPGFPFIPMTRDLRFHWVRGRSLTRDREAWLPANLVYGNWYVGPYADTPRFNNLFHPGLAAGQSLDFAITAGMQEIVERHATMAWWLNAPALPSLRLTGELSALWAGRPTELGQRAALIPLDNEFGVPVMAGIVENTADRLLTIGFAARPDPHDAALKAWAEALTLQDAARDLLRENGGYRQAERRGEVNASFVKPWRADRRYLDDYRADARDVVDLMAQLQTYLDPRAIERVRHIIDTPAVVDLDELPRLADYSVGSYQRAIEAKGHEIFYADITTRDVARAGMSAVRVLIPGLIPNFAAAFPYYGKRRIQDIAVELGWRSTPLEEHEMNPYPLPHA